MEEKYSNGVEWWFAELGSESEVDKRIALFPELNSRLPKFVIGFIEISTNLKLKK